MKSANVFSQQVSCVSVATIIIIEGNFSLTKAIKAMIKVLESAKYADILCNYVMYKLYGQHL